MPVSALNVTTFVPTPAGPTVTPQGAGGAATWGYKIVGVDAAGNTTAAGVEGTTAGGNANLTGANFNRITWADPANVTSVRIYRTTVGTSPVTLGLIGTVAAGVQTFDDTGLAGGGTAAPTASTAGEGVETNVSQYLSKWVSIDGTFVATLQVQARIGNSFINVGSAATAPAFVEVPQNCTAVRIKQTAYTSGTPAASLAFRTLNHST